MRWIALCLALLAVPAWAQQIKTYYYVATAYDAQGIESDTTNEASSWVSPVDPTISLSWTLPIMRTDGSALTDLAGIRLYRSATSGACRAALKDALPAGCVMAEDTESATITSYVDSPPVPSAPLPPMNLTVQATDTTAYKLRQSVGGVEFVAYGRLPAGTSCDSSHDFDGYRLVNRDLVRMFSRFDTQPPNAFARCG